MDSQHNDLGSDGAECVTWVTLGHGPYSEIGAARSALSCLWSIAELGGVITCVNY